MPAQAAGTDPILQKLDHLETQIYDDPVAAYQEARGILPTLNRETQPQLWIRAWILALGENTEVEAIKDIDRWIALAETAGLAGEEVRLLVKKAEVYQSTWHEQQVKDIYTRAKNLAEKFQLAELSARALYEEAYYLYSLHEFPQALQNIGEAVRLGEKFNNDREIFRYEFRSVLAAVLNATGDHKRAIATYEACIEWAQTKQYRSSLAAYAYNAAMVLVYASSKDEGRIMRYFELTATQAHAIHDQQKEGLAIAGQARYLKDRGRYLEAKTLFTQSTAIFKSINSSYNYQAGIVSLVDTYIKLDQLEEAQKLADVALSILTTDFRHEKKSLMESLSNLSFLKKDYAKAYIYLREYLKVFAEIKGNEEQNHLQKLKTELGLELEEERSAKLQRLNEAQGRELILTHRLRIVAIVLFILLGITALTMTLAIRRGRSVLRAKEKIQSILDTIEEGLLTLNEKFIVSPDHSAYAQRLFPHEQLAGQDIFTLLLNRAEASAEDKSLWKESLSACMGEDAIAWDINSGHLPTEIQLQGKPARIFSLHWQPLIRQHHVERFLLSIRDVTDVKKLQDDVAIERRQREELQTHIMEILSHNFQEAKRIVLGLGQELPNIRRIFDQNADATALRRRLHTDKGAARTLGLQALSRRIHALEDAIKQGGPARDESLRALESEQNAYARVFSDILRTPHHQEQNQNLLQAANSLLPDITKRLQDGSVSLQSMDVLDHVVQWPPQLLDAVRKILLHAMTNAVDHGFLLPNKKGISVPEAHFQILAQRSNRGIALQIKDNGAGLDWPRLQKIADERGFVPEEGQTLADVLLLDGVSTADQVSETSGRGVGLAAVKAICHQCQGTLRIADNSDGRGTQLDITLNF